ncbi:hypothetical protein FLA_6403 [Filimonas lacunae]|nr:hypothetical protein FLA_6403 [Filimonas lacunae]
MFLKLLCNYLVSPRHLFFSYRHVLVLMVCFIYSAAVLAQDIHVSQFTETPLLRNPALAGIFTGDVRVQVLHRNQWSWTGYPFKTTSLSGEYKFPVGAGSNYITAGFQGYYDMAGSSRLKTTQIMPVFNFHKSLSTERSEYLSIGFTAGLIQRQFDANNLTFDYQYVNGNYNAGNPNGENFAAYNRSFADVGVGLSYNNEIGENGSYYLGASLMHVNKPTETFQKERIALSSKMQLNVGLHVPVSDQITMHTECNYSRQGGFNEWMAGALFTYELSSSELYNSDVYNTASVSAGLLARLKDAVVPVIKLQYQQFEIGVSYDVNTSSLKTASMGKGGFEFSLSYKAFTRADAGSANIQCPRF